MVDLEQRLRGGSLIEAARRLAESHGIVTPEITNSSSNINGHRANGTQGPNGSHFDWQLLVDAVTDEHLAELSEWRGFSPAFCRSLRDRKLIGRHGGQWALPVHRDGEVVSAHCRVIKTDGRVKWYYQPPTKVQPLVIGPLQRARIVHGFESPWDQFSFTDKLGPIIGTVSISTRGRGNAKLLDCIPKDAEEIILWPQNDKAGREWLKDAIEVLGDRQIKIAQIPERFKDLNEWTKSGATPEDIQTAIDAATTPEPEPALEEKTGLSNEAFCEEALAIQLGAQIGELRSVNDDWFVCENGVWKPRDRDEFKPLALAVLPEAYRTQRRARDVQLHLEMRSQVPRSGFCGAMRFGAAGEVMIAIRGGTLVIPAKESEAVRLIETDKNQGFTIALPVSYNPEAVPETFARALMEAVPDPQERELFLDVLATALVPDCRYERALVAIGETGAGKSTVCSPLPLIFGEACSFLSLADLCHPQGYKLALLNRKAINVGTELNTLEFDDSGLFKQLVSGERLTVRAIYGRPFEMTSHASLVFLANSLPRFKHGTQAEVRRIGFVRFDHKPDEPDVTLKSRVAADAEGLFVELVRRAQELLASRPITEPGRWGQKTAERFALTNDPVGEFVARHCNLAPGLQCEKAHLWAEFTEFCERASLSDKLDERWFFRTLYDRFPGMQQRQVRTGDGRTGVITGVDIKD